MVSTETGKITTIAAVIYTVIVAVVGSSIALERVRSASHWTRETRAVNSLRDSIAGVTVAHDFCVLVSL